MTKLASMVDSAWREFLAFIRCCSKSISGVAFASGHVCAILILIATAFCPRFLSCGGLAIGATWIAARLAGFGVDQLGTGSILRNAFLTGLAVAWISIYWEWTAVKWPWLAIVAGLFGAMVSAAADNILGRMLPPMNTGFLIVASALFTVHGGKSLADPELVHQAILAAEPDFLPGWILTLGRAFGVICFLPNASLGLLVALAVLLRSRLMLLCGLAGWCGGLFGNAVIQYLAPWTFDAGIFTYNALLVGMAMGSYFVASRGTYILAAMAGAFSMFLWHAITTFFAHWAAAQILSIPFLLTSWIVLAAMRQRTTVGNIVPMTYPGTQPEIAAAQAAEYGLRFPAAGIPVLELPFAGVRAVTQSEDGEITHRGAWRHAIDFEVRDEAGRPAPPGSQQLESFYSSGFPVLAPISGTIVRVVNEVPDNKIGETNFEQNWGNLVIIQSTEGFHVLLAHFRQKSIAVFRGQWVEAGQYLGLCGNSGRSPIPHLHVHCQRTAKPGDPTIPFVFRNYVLHARDGAGEWCAYGLPGYAARIERFEADPAIAAVLQGWRAERTQFTVISPNGLTLRRTLEISFTDDGYWLFQVPEETAECKGCAVNSGFRLFDLRTRESGLLTAIFLALSSVPFTAGSRLQWQEKLPARRVFFGGGWPRRKNITVRRRCFAQEGADKIEISGESDRVSTVAVIAKSGGLRRLVWDTPKGRWTAAAIGSAAINQTRKTMRL